MGCLLLQEAEVRFPLRSFAEKNKKGCCDVAVLL